MQKNEIIPLSYTIHKNQLKMVKDLNLRLETIKFLEENVQEKLLDIGLSNEFLDMTPEAQTTRAKLNR